MSANQKTCPCCGQAIRATRKASAVPVATTPAEFLEPVGRRKFGKDRAVVPVECTFADGEVIRLTIGRHPKDSDALAVEAGRRTAVLLRAESAYLGPARAAAAAIRAEAYADAIERQRIDWAEQKWNRDQTFDPTRHARIAEAEAQANEACRARAPKPPLVWHGKRLSYPADVIEQAARDLADCRIAPPDSLYADAAD